MPDRIDVAYVMERAGSDHFPPLGPSGSVLERDHDHPDGCVWHYRSSSAPWQQRVPQLLADGTTEAVPKIVRDASDALRRRRLRIGSDACWVACRGGELPLCGINSYFVAEYLGPAG